jgi:hypothetical protein
MPKAKEIGFGTTFTFTMTRRSFADDIDFYPDEKLEIVLGNADELTLDQLLVYVANFIAASGYIVKGPLEFPELEQERTLRTLAQPDRKL